MAVTTPTLSEIRGRTAEPGTLQVTRSSLDRDKEQSSNIFSGFAGLLSILLVITVFCVLWNWNKRKKWQAPYLRTTAGPSLTLPRQGQRAKNTYDLLPRRQEELGRHQPRSIRIFSTESLLSRNSDSPPSEHMPSQAGTALQTHRAHPYAVGYAVGIYDNAMGPHVCENLTPSAHYVNIGASRDCPSISSEDSRDYVNVPTAEEIAESLASTSSPPGNLFDLPRAQELEFPEERDEGCGNASDCPSFWSPGTESSDPLSDGEDSSQTSNDYVNMAGLDLGAIQGKQPWAAVQCCRDYENVPPADSNGNQQQVEEEVTSSNTDRVEGRTDGPGTHIQPVMQSGRFLALEDYVACWSSAQSENSQMKHGEEVSNEDSNDYENVLAAKLGGRDSEQEPETQLLPDELRSSHPAGKPCEMVYPARSVATTGSSEDP
ncbi:lymphocyte transmembrane adapter 1 [Diceros bicornis minor]|uniref:lymphocyte transmembrane adapter 1 n=1 Tax=Diceros bicornis minor TaxID=77932 RepID=UPI0026F0A427|nr:lymphocyte transmembrane adapter 1 [Diceros bicornis minor]XP_058396279.1 lymphocyte transmembrane adapter 1 [Diceros bicornis minor]